MATPETLVPLGIAPHLRPLPSAGVTRHPRSYGPLRHPAGPTCPSRAVGWRVPRHQPGLPVLRPFPSSMRAAANTPAEPVGACVVRFPTGDSLPRYQGGSASASNLSRPARLTSTPYRTLTGYPLPVSLAHARMVAKPPLAARYVGVLQTMSLPPSSAPTATGWSDSCRAGFAPAEEWRLTRRTR